MTGYAYAADNPTTSSDPSGLGICGGASHCGGGFPHAHQPPPSGCGGCGGASGNSGAINLGIIGAGGVGGILTPLNSPTELQPPPGFPEDQYAQIGIDNYVRALQAVNSYYTGKPQAQGDAGLVIARVTMDDGSIRTVVFASESGIPQELLDELDALGAAAYNLTGLPADDAHAEAAASVYRQQMGDMPTANQITSVHDAYSTIRVCSDSCAHDLTDFIDVPGVEIPAQSNGYLAGRVIDSQTLSEMRSYTGPGRALDVVTRYYEQFSSISEDVPEDDG